MELLSLIGAVLGYLALGSMIAEGMLWAEMRLFRPADTGRWMMDELPIATAITLTWPVSLPMVALLVGYAIVHDWLRNRMRRALRR